MKISQETSFDAAHRLLNYSGNCSRLHGHRWSVSVYIEADNPKLDNCNMFVDYREIKQYVKDTYDHTAILNNKDPLCEILSQYGCTVTKVTGNPTAENLAKIICNHFYKLTRIYNTFVEITIHESPENYAKVNSVELLNLEEF